MVVGAQHVVEHLSRASFLSSQDLLYVNFVENDNIDMTLTGQITLLEQGNVDTAAFGCTIVEQIEGKKGTLLKIHTSEKSIFILLL